MHMRPYELQGASNNTPLYSYNNWSADSPYTRCVGNHDHSGRAKTSGLLCAAELGAMHRVGYGRHAIHHNSHSVQSRAVVHRDRLLGGVPSGDQWEGGLELALGAILWALSPQLFPMSRSRANYLAPPSDRLRRVPAPWSRRGSSACHSRETHTEFGSRIRPSCGSLRDGWEAPHWDTVRPGLCWIGTSLSPRGFLTVSLVFAPSVRLTGQQFTSLPGCAWSLFSWLRPARQLKDFTT